MQLVAYGAQDIYLTGNPQITFFKVVYRRHTNFAVESIEQTFNGSAKLGNKFSCTISRNGDLLSQVYLEMDVTVTNRLSSVQSLTIGGTAVPGTTGNLAVSTASNGVVTISGTDAADAIDTATLQANTAAGVADVTATQFDDLTNQISVSGVNGSQRIGLRAIKYIEVEIGGQCIDKHYGEWMDIWVGLSKNSQQWIKHNRLVNATLSNNTGSKKLYVPLQFWFCQNPGLALPLIALQYHEVKLNVEFNQSVTWTHTLDANTTPQVATSITESNGVTFQSSGAIVYDDGNGNQTINANSVIEITNATTRNIMTINNCCVFCDYIFLDTDERRRFAQVSHEYLIEQLQYSNALNLNSGNNQFELRFNHPVKELVWAAQTDSDTGNNFNYFPTNTTTNPEMITKALLQLNGHDRFREREGSYFRCVQPYQYHSGADGQSKADEWGGYYMYSFALKPADHQPSGTCNFSRIDNAVLTVNAVENGVVKVFARNYNVLRIMSGMGGLAYSN